MTLFGGPGPSPVSSHDPGSGGRLSDRLALVRLLVVLAFLGLALQLARLQLLSGGHYQLQAAQNRITIVQETPPRGIIYDRNGQQLVYNVPQYNIVLYPAWLSNTQLQDVEFRLQQLLNVPAYEIADNVRKGIDGGRRYDPVVVKEAVDRDAALRIAGMRAELPGVQVQSIPIRYYPMGPAMAQVLGFTGRINAQEYATLKDRGYQPDSMLGQSGVEYTDENLLRGVPGTREEEVDVTGRVVRTLGGDPPKPGASIVLSIDSRLQAATTGILQQAMDRSHSNIGVAMVMDVHTGELLALASLPTYDNNVFSGKIDDAKVEALLKDPNRPLLDHAISAVYPPGSVFKQVTATAGLQDGVITPQTRFVSHGVLYVPNQYAPWIRIPFLDTARCDCNLAEAIAHSSNVYFYHVAGGSPDPANGTDVGVGPNHLAHWARLYGLDEKTGIDLPGETEGIVPDPQWKLKFTEKAFGHPESWYLGDTYNFGIGQSYLLVTPLEMLRVTAAVANGGDILRPTVVHQIVDSDGTVIRTTTPQVVRHLPVNPANLAAIRAGMRLCVTDPTAYCYSARVNGVEVAGKTGTAQYGVADPKTGKEPEHAWFSAFAPYNNPEVAVLVFLEHGVGAIDAAPVGGQILTCYFQLKAGAKQCS